MGSLAVPFVAMAVHAFTEEAAAEAPTTSHVGTLVDAPPPIILVALGLLMVAAAVARRSRKVANGRGAPAAENP